MLGLSPATGPNPSSVTKSYDVGLPVLFAVSASAQ